MSSKAVFRWMMFFVVASGVNAMNAVWAILTSLHVFYVILPIVVAGLMVYQSRCCYWQYLDAMKREQQ